MLVAKIVGGYSLMGLNVFSQLIGIVNENIGAKINQHMELDACHLIFIFI